jgi:hypothetical protein
LTKSEADRKSGLFLKHPNSSFLNAAIYFHYDFGAKTVILMVFGSYLVEIESRLLQLFPPGRTVPMSGRDDPFVVITAVMAEYSSMMEYERRRLDFSVRDQESKTGVTAHFYDESLRAQATEYGDLIRALRLVEGYVMSFARILDFQVGLLRFLEEQHMRFQTLSQSCGENVERNPMTLRVGDSLQQSLSLTTHRLEQVKTLDRRIQIQLGVVRMFFLPRSVIKLISHQVQNLISQNDSRVNILVATQSANIAMDTRKDSVAMKTIAGITMVFLPGTFVAVSCPFLFRGCLDLNRYNPPQTFFSMVFFHIEGNDSNIFAVNSYWWLYLAVTIPLTLAVGLAWYGMLKRGHYSKLRAQTSETLDLEKDST